MQTKHFLKRAVVQAALAAFGLAATAAHAAYIYKVSVPQLQVKPGSGSNNGGSEPETPPSKVPGSLVLDAGQLSFGLVDLGSGASLSFGISNPGELAASVSSIAIGSGSSDFLTSSNTCGSQLAAGGSCRVNIEFRPAARGARVGSVSIQGASGSQAVSLSGTGLSPAFLTANTANVSFNSAAVGTTSAETKTVTLNNTGDRDLVVSSVSLPSGSDSFTTTTGCVGTITAGGSCNLTVGFKPQGQVNSGLLRIVSNASNAPAADITLNGTGLLPPAVSTSTNAVSFAAAAIGSTSAEVKSVTVTNTGDAPLTISSVTVPTGSTAFTASGCVGSLAAGNSCAINVTFKPQAASNTGSLRITSNATNSPTKDVTLDGAGTAAPLLSLTSANPSFASWAIGYTSTETKPVTLKNTGTAPLTISAIAFNPTSSVYTNSGNCVTTLAPNASCTLTMSFKPAAASNAANLRVTSNAANTPSMDIPVAGMGRAAGNVYITKAVYGLNVTINSSGNLTTNLRAACLNKSVCVFDPFAVLGSDPSPNNAKNLELTYTCTSTGSTSYSYSAGAEAGLRNHTLTCP